MAPFLKSISFFFFGIFIGIGIGIGIFFLLPFFPINASSPVYTMTGIQKSRIVGFLPYFLLTRANKDYSPYITTLTYFGLTIDTDGSIVKLANPQQENSGWHDLRIPEVQKIFDDAKRNHVDLSLSVVQQDEASISALLSD